jgi:hypothetical protein
MTGALVLAAVLGVTASVEVTVDADLGHATIARCASPGDCVNERVALDVRANASTRFGRDRIVSPFPGLDEAVRPLDVRFALPAGVAVSAPGVPLDDTMTRYRLAPSPGGWPAIVALGRFERRALDLPGARLDVVVLDGEPAPDVDVLMAWVEAAARDVTRVYGAFPVPRVQVIVTPVAGRTWRGRPMKSEPVPFGRVLRDGGEAVQFFVNQTADASALRGDWTATHEFSHLLLPYVDRSDGWLSEGFATYYQNLLLARAGVYTERDAWRRLVEGFARGRRARYADTLDESIANDGENHLMRMYWSGAAIALLADVSLRREAGSSLDAVLAGLRDQLPSRERWTARRVMAALDAAGGAGRFESLRAHWTGSRDFPDVDATLRDLGVLIVDGAVRLDDTAPLSAVRRAIMLTPD